MPHKVVVVVISFVSQYTFRYMLFGGRISASGFVCMGNRAWVLVQKLILSNGEKQSP